MFKLRNAVFCLALVATHAGAENLFKAGSVQGWELVTTPAVPLTEVVALRPDGVIAVAGKPAGFFATLQSYRNYQLHFEWRWDGKPGNAGVLLHISQARQRRRSAADGGRRIRRAADQRCRRGGSTEGSHGAGQREAGRRVEQLRRRRS
jgi:hypothetical protein